MSIDTATNVESVDSFAVIGIGHSNGMDMRWRTNNFDTAMDKGFEFASKIYIVKHHSIGVAKVWIGADDESKSMVGWIFAPRNNDGCAEWEPSGPLVFMMIEDEDEDEDE
mgnify:CR=1 FL=1